MPISSVAPRSSPRDPAAGHPHGEAGRVVIAAPTALLTDGGAAELAAPDDKGLIEQSRPLEVGQKRGDGLVGHAAHLLVIGVDVVMSIPLHGHRPASRIELDEPHSPLNEPSGQQAPGAELDGPGIIEPIHGLSSLRLGRQVNRFGRCALHAEGQLVRRDPRRKLGVGRI